MISETDTKRFFGSIFGLLNSVGVPNEGGKCIKKQMFKFLSDMVLQDWAWRRGNFRQGVVVAEDCVVGRISGSGIRRRDKPSLAGDWCLLSGECLP